MAKNQTSWMPLARTAGMSVTVAGTETLVYDAEKFTIHRLTPEAAAIWQLADGTLDVPVLAAAVGVNPRVAEDALHDLTTLGLIQNEVARKSRLSRRHLVGGAAGLAAASTFISVSANLSSCAPPSSATCWTGEGCKGNSVAATCDELTGRWMCEKRHSTIEIGGVCYPYSSGLPVNSVEDPSGELDESILSVTGNDAEDFAPAGSDGDGESFSNIDTSVEGNTSFEPVSTEGDAGTSDAEFVDTTFDMGSEAPETVEIPADGN